MMATRLVLSRRTLRHNNQRRHWCRRCSVSRYAANNNNAPSLLLDTKRSPRISWTRFSNTNSNSDNPRSSSNNSFFLTPGFQPTSITGDNIGFYQGSTFYDGAPPNVLPTLNASPILSPGKYVRQSSWSSSSSRHHLNSNKNNNGAKSGTAAALRLVDARREFMSLMKTELLGSSSHNTNDGSDKEVAIEDVVRKLYALEGHGVPTELLSHLTEMARGWTAPPPQPLVAQTQNSSSSVVQVSFQNVPNSTLLNRDQIQLIHTNGYTAKVNDMLNHGGGDWEHDFDLYMVVMDRIASRLASFALMHPPLDSPHHHDSGTSTTVDDGGDYHNNDNEAALGSSGSVITPASLQRWNVIMMEGEALPLTLLPIRKRSERQSSSIVLTVEWVCNNKRDRNDYCNIVLRLQDDGLAATALNDGGRGPISLVFDGVYV